MQEMLNHIRNNRPLIHCITNYVTANDCANLLLACGASPVMADATEEAAEITAESSALVLNLGTLNQQRFAAMLEAGASANQKGIPVVFDPVGAGASAFRRSAAKTLLERIRITAIRGNPSEIRFLADGCSSAAGVDAVSSDPVETLKSAQILAGHTKAIVIATGERDIVTDGTNGYLLRTGHPVMKQVTGAGCMLSALTAAFLTAAVDATCCASAVCAMGLAGITAANRMQAQDGNASFRNYLIDAFFHMTDQQISDAFDQCVQII